MRALTLWAALVVAVVAMPVASLDAAIYAGWGTLAFNRTGQDFSLCFAGDSVDARADRAVNVLDHLRHVEWAANIRFHPPGNKAIRIQSGAALNARDWRCPRTDPVNGALPQGDLGDLRVLLSSPANAAWWKLPLVGGEGCAIDNRPSNWGVIGNEPVLSRWCHFNMKLGDVAPAGTRDYYLNHTLHEVGHRLGLEHEWDRTDAPCHKGTMANGATVKMADYRGTAVTSAPMVFMTPFDPRSVMMYRLPACNSPGNLASTGFSDLDRLALRILYPEDVRVAEVDGLRVVRAGAWMQLRNLWKTLGAFVDETPNSVARNFAWTVNGETRATSPDFSARLPGGRHLLRYAFEDFLGRSYAFETSIDVLTPAAFAQRMAAQSALTALQ